MKKLLPPGGLVVVPSWPRRACLQAALMAGVAVLPARAAGSDPAGPLATVSRQRVLRFPRDHGAHLQARIEWWYLTGALQAQERTGPDGLWGFQITFFRARTGVALELPGRLAPRQLLFAHAALSGIGAQRHWHADRIARWDGQPDAPGAHAAIDTTDVAIGRWHLRRAVTGAASPAHAALQLAADALGSAARPGFAMRLSLQRQQPLLLQGQAGFSRKGPQESQASHYYSEPHLQARGQLQVQGQTLEVSGRAWLDHEWSDEIMHPDAVGWDWIGISLDDGSALTAFQLRRSDASALWAGGSFRRPGQAQAQVFAADEVRFVALRSWQSPSSGARYPVAWTVQCPAGAFEVHALMDAQELDSRGSTGTIYWEGLSELRGTSGARLGLGYLEMTGYAGRLRI